MSLPKEYMKDAAVRDAMHNLLMALVQSLTARDADLKTLMIVARASNGVNGVALIGCDCPHCKASIMKSATVACAGTLAPIHSGTVTITEDGHSFTEDSPVKAVH